MPTKRIPEQLEFEAFDRRRVVAVFDGGAISTDADALLLRHCASAIRLFDRVASCFIDHRTPELVMHELPTLVGQRICGIVLGYEDLNDHDQRRHDPVLALLSDRLEAKRKDCAVLSGKSTLNRLEHAQSGAPGHYHRIGHDGETMERLFVDLYLDAHAAAPARIMLDLDATDDPVHGTQEDRFYHGDYRSYCYLPLHITCGHHLLAAKLRPANIDGAAGAQEEVARIVAQVRERWPRVEIVLRVDSGFAREDIMAWCEGNGVGYLFADRTSAATMRANQLRLWFASLAYVLVDRLRRIALPGTALARATAGSIRLKLLKLGARVTVSVRRIKIAMASAHPWRREFSTAHERLSISAR